MGLQFGYLLGGSILVETVFNWPGSGNLLNLAIFRRDIPVLQATILVLACVLRPAQPAGRHRCRRRSTRASGAERSAPMSEATIDLAAALRRSRTRAGHAGAGLLEVGRPAPAARSGHHRRDAGAAAASCSSRSARRWSPTAIRTPAASSRRLKPIGTPGHWLGTDETGRDMWTRLCYGGRLSLLPAIVPVTIALLVGGMLGILAGYVGGRVNTLIMRTMDVFYAFPSILLAVAICGMLGNGLSQRDPRADDGVHPADRARVGDRHRRRCARWTSSRRRARPAPARCRSSATTCWPTCWGRSWSTPPA